MVVNGGNSGAPPASRAGTPQASKSIAQAARRRNVFGWIFLLKCLDPADHFALMGAAGSREIATASVQVNPILSPIRIRGRLPTSATLAVK